MQPINIFTPEWGLDVSEILIMISTMSAVIVVMLHSHRNGLQKITVAHN